MLPKVSSGEAYRSCCFDELTLSFPCNLSYRNSQKTLNRIRWQDANNQTKHRTIANIIEREGSEIQQYIDSKTDIILEQSGVVITESGAIVPDEIKSLKRDIKYIDQQIVAKEIENYNVDKPRGLQIDISEIHESFECPDTSATNISIDDVQVKKQKETDRSPNARRKKHKEYAKNTVTHIQKGDNKYTLNGPNIPKTLKFLLGFMIYNNLLDQGALVFLADGADDIKKGIQKFFGWIPYKVILDWVHLKKKCEQRLSQAIKGKDNRNMVLDELLSYLWVGKVDSAVNYLRQLDPNVVKNKENIKLLIQYFDRNWSSIPCYALRKALGLKVSSNAVEKSNDLIVSDRQKHNGTSWSKDGSVSLATVTTLHLNKEQDTWIRNKYINFKLEQYAA